ncbi:MAG: VanW family protein, partial [Clostridiales bacterium]|nr:VanW family protein [Clostridiales bacterium]
MKIELDEKKKSLLKKIGIGAAGVLVAGGIGVFFYLNNKGGSKSPATSSGTESTTVSAEEVSPSELENMKKVVDDTAFYSGIKINGTDVGGKTIEEVKALFAGDEDDSQTPVLDIQFQVDGELVKVNTDGLKVKSNIDEVIEEAYNYGRTSELTGDDAVKERYDKIEELKNTPAEFEIKYEVNEDLIETLARQALEPHNTEVKEASIDGFDVEKLEFIISESQDGVVMDMDKALSDMKEKLDNNEFTCVVDVSAEVAKPETSADDLRAILGKVSSTTSETTDNDNRNTNIRLVCEALDGLVLQPGEQFNFNNYIGQRTSEKGYKLAHGIYNGSMRDELGGGICQANTMLYQSVTKADLQVDERKNHSIPSTYVDKGTDATVTWYSPNFRFTNNSDYPIAIHAYYADLHVTVEIFGRLLPDGQYIELVGEHVRTISPSTTYVNDPNLPAGEQKKTQSGRTGYDYKSYKVWYDKDGNEIKREPYFSSHYPCRNAVINVGTGGAAGTVDPNTGAIDTTPTDTATPPADTGTPPADTAAPADTTPAAPADTTPAAPADTTPAAPPPETTPPATPPADPATPATP